VDDARGGSSIIAAVRSARVINRMAQAEAELADIPANKKNFYFRVDIGKRNMAPPPEKATWYRLCSVELANGDAVQALRLWEFPRVFDHVEIVDTEYIRELVKQKSWRADRRSPDWLGYAVATRLHLDPTSQVAIAKINRLITVWLANGLFVKRTMDDETRRPREFYVSSPDTNNEREEDEEGDDDEDV
jgi:hypothetical protein